MIIVLSYEDTDPHRATQIVNTVGQVSSDLSERSAAGNEFTVGLYKSAIIPENPVSPHPWRNGLLTLAIGLALCAWTAPAGGTASPA